MTAPTFRAPTNSAEAATLRTAAADAAELIAAMRLQIQQAEALRAAIVNALARSNLQ